MSPQAGWNLQAEVSQSVMPHAVHCIGTEARLPGWRNTLDCEREAQACRNDRRARAA